MVSKCLGFGNNIIKIPTWLISLAELFSLTVCLCTLDDPYSPAWKGRNAYKAILRSTEKHRYRIVTSNLTGFLLWRTFNFIAGRPPEIVQIFRSLHLLRSSIVLQLIFFWDKDPSRLCFVSGKYCIFLYWVCVNFKWVSN